MTMTARIVGRSFVKKEFFTKRETKEFSVVMKKGVVMKNEEILISHLSLTVTTV